MRICVLSLLLLATALPVGAQPAPDTPPSSAPTLRDPIADILDRRVPLSKDEDEPDTAGQPRAGPEIEPGVVNTTLPPHVYTPPPKSQFDAPVHLDEIGKTPDGPPTLRDLAYDTRIRSSFASAESFQGPLDGGWMLSAGGQDIYALQLVDRRDRLEGVWRDIRRKGTPNASGLVDDMRRQGADLVLRFAPAPDAAATVVTVHNSTNGLWTGELVEGANRWAVALRRTGP